MLMSTLLSVVFIAIFGSNYCTNDISNPTPVYVVQGDDVVLQCGFESSSLSWYVYNGGSWDIRAAGGDTINGSKYSVSMNPATGLYYRLHILNVGVSDGKEYRCEALINGMILNFYIQLILIVLENATPENRLLGTEGQDLTVSCKAVGGKPAPNVVLIIDGQTVANQTQTVQHTLTTINGSYDRKTVKCQAFFLTDSAMIYLNLKPLPPTINGNVGSIVETNPLIINCTTKGSRPRATLKWTIGQKDVTSDATEWSNYNTDSETYTVLSDLKYSVGMCDHGQELRCKAVNVAAPSGLQTSITLNVTSNMESSTSGPYAGVIGGLVTVIIMLIIIIVTLLCKRYEGLSDGRHDTHLKGNDTTPSTNPMTNVVYEDIREDTNDEITRNNGQSNNRVEDVSLPTYEMLGIKDPPNTYGDLTSGQDPKEEEYIDMQM